MDATKKNSTLKDILGKLGPLLALVILCIALGIATGGTFFSAANISNLFRQVPIVALMAVGMSVCNPAWRYRPVGRFAAGNRLYGFRRYDAEVL